MSPAFIDNIVNVKNQILDQLKAIKDTQQALQVQLASDAIVSGKINDGVDKTNDLLRTNSEEHEREIAELRRELTRDLSDHAKNLERLLAVSGNTINEINDLLIEYCLPTLDPYSYSAAINDFRLKNPEIALLQHLRAFIPSRNALDIGANTGNVTELLLSAGYKVYAFEPCDEAYQQLSHRFDGNADCKCFSLGVSAEDGNRELHTVTVAPSAAHMFDKNLTLYSSLVEHPTPAEMQFTSSTEVQVKSLKSLHQARLVPLDIGIVKIDTEGGDLDVIRGMGIVYYSCVMTEFWDQRHYFSGGTTGLLSQTVSEMRKRGYNWHIVIYRIVDGDSPTEPRFYANIDQSVEYSTGNVVFFKEFQLFTEALRWCTANMRQNETFR
ncbi:MAG TPA: FkbM family methyltransferase [Trichormus sp.]